MINLMRGNPNQEPGRYRPTINCFIISCPRCGTQASIDKTEVDEHGRTERSIACPNPECTGDDFLRLVGHGTEPEDEIAA